MSMGRRMFAGYAAGAVFLLAGALVAGGADAATRPGVVAEMQALIEKHAVPPKFIPPGPPLDAPKLKGKTISIQMIDGRIGAIADVAHAIQQAAAEAGLKTTIFDAQSSPVRMQQGFQQAIDSHADAIVNAGDPVQLVADQIKAAKAKGIPTVEVINSPPVIGVPGQGSIPATFGNVSTDAFLDGELSAAAAIVHTDGKAHVVIMTSSDLSAAATIVKGMKAALAKCPGCSIVQVTDTPVGEWSTAITGLAATLVRAHPDVNYLLPIYSGMGIFATAGVQQAGATGRVHIASFNGTPAAEALVKNGSIFTVNTAEDHDWEGWAAVDQCMRGMLGMQPANPVAPVRFVDTKMLKGVDTSSSKTLSEALFGDAYKAGFMKLWGLK